MADRKPRGELAELSASLQNLCTAGKRTDKELRSAKKDAFKKVINYMTLGMDMSALFPMMTSCANLSADDIVLKKMLYLYIAHYATQTPDLALLAINQLHKDCHDQDPTVRGLALRTLCSLRVPNFLEYVTAPVNSGLDDRHPYVRRTAVMGVLKMYHIDQSVVHNQGLLERVRRMLYNDHDAQVVANCLTVVMQVEDLKRLADKVLVYSLLNRLKEFSDWSQCQVLELTSHYIPSGEGEVYDILNALEDRMGHVNSAVSLTTIKVFLHMTLSMTATHQQVLERIKEPLKTLISREDPATTYAVLSHVLLIVQRAPIIFEQDYVSFYCRTHDPSYIKRLKIEILTSIASSSNVYDIVGELSEYARDISPAMAREAVRAVGRIALAVPDASGVIERLLIFLEAGYDHIQAEALVQMKDLLRRYPDMAEVCLAQVSDINPADVSEPEAKAALLWIVGQFGQHVQMAPYLLEPLVESFAAEEPCVRLALLTAGARLFFKRPPECQRLLGALLAAGVNDSNQDVHDRALLYYRLLKADPSEAERILSPPLLAVTWFSEAMSAEMKDRVFMEFNSLSVVYQAPASTFVDKRAYHQEDLEGDSGEGSRGTGAQGSRAAGKAAAAPDLLADHATTLLPAEASAEVDLLDLDISGGGAAQPAAAGFSGATAAAPAGAGSGGGIDLGNLLGDVLGGGGFGGPVQSQPAGATGFGSLMPGFGGSAPAAPAPAAQPVPAGGNGNLLDLDDILGGFGGGQQSSGQQQQGTTVLELHLNPQARLGASAFQDAWKSLPPCHQYSEGLSPETIAAMVANQHRDWSAHLQQAYIQTMASGGQHPSYKYYMYAQSSDSGALFLVEMVARADAGQASMVFKTQATELLPQFLELWGNLMMGFMR